MKPELETLECIPKKNHMQNKPYAKIYVWAREQISAKWHLQKKFINPNIDDKLSSIFS